MANVDPSKASSSGQVNEACEATVEIHIKTLDSQIYTFRVESNMSIARLKEKISGTVGVPTGQQRLIFRGRVLKDDHTLSDYHVEDGHTLHLVARQPVQSQNEAGINSDQPLNQNGNIGNDTGEGTQRTRIGHSVVVGLNVSDQGEGTAAVDISRIVGAVLNSFGLGIANSTLVAGNSSSAVADASHVHVSQGGDSDSQNVSGGVQIGNQPPNPLTGAFLRQMVVPDSLTTLSAYMTRMEQTLSLYTGNAVPPQGAVQENTSSSPSIYPNLDGLNRVIDQAHRLLSGPGTEALRHLSGHLERGRASSELAVRGQIQAEAMHVGVSMQHLGSLLLELGRTISTVRMGEPPVEPMVNSGPAVYINASGPNPLMVQPNSHPPIPIFGIPSPPVNIGVPEAVVLGDTPRNISIHVHAGNSSAAGTPVGSTLGEVTRGQPANSGLPILNFGSGGESGLTRVLQSGTVVAAIPSHSRTSTTGGQGSGAVYPANPNTRFLPSATIVNMDGLSLLGPNLLHSSNRSRRNNHDDTSQFLSRTGATAEPAVSSTTIAEDASCAASVCGNISQSLSAQTDKETRDAGSSILQDSNISSSVAGEQNDSYLHENKATVEAGNRSNFIPQAQDSSSSGAGDLTVSGLVNLSCIGGVVDSGGVARDGLTKEKVPTSSSISEESYLDGHTNNHIINDTPHASGSNRTSDSGESVPLGLGLGGLQPMRRPKRTVSHGKNAIPHAGTHGADNKQLIAKGQQVLQSLVSQSPKQKVDKDGTTKSAAEGGSQEVEVQNANLGGVFSGMVQQMMPAVSQMLGMGQSTPSRSTPVPTSRSNNRGGILSVTNSQVDLQNAVQRIAEQDSAGNIFRAVLEAASRLHGEQNASSFIDILGNDEQLANEFVEMLQRHLRQRLQSESGSGPGSSS